MSGSLDAAMMASAAGVKQILLVHSMSSLDRDEVRHSALRGIAQHFDGHVQLAAELMHLQFGEGRLSPPLASSRASQTRGIE